MKSFQKMSTIVLLVLFSKGFAETNIAHGKPAKVCGENVTNVVTNGDITDVEQGVFIQPCPGENFFIEVFLDIPQYVLYVIVTEGAFREELAGCLDYFEVHLLYNNTLVERCSTFPSKSYGVGKHMRVNCRSDIATRVRISSLKNNGLSIAEIRVFTLAEVNSEITTLYYGCFSDFVSKAPREFTDVMTCLRSCKKFQFAAILNEKDCECGHPRKNDPVEPEHCNIICGNKYCGGEKHYSVYLVNISLPYYSGCYGPISKLNDGQGFQTYDECIDRCMRDDKATAALLEMTYPNNYCACRPYNSYYVGQKGLWGNEDSGLICKLPCPGAEHDSCYGFESFNVFSIARLRPESVDSFQFFNCNGSMDRYGVCDKCKPFFKGSYCFGEMIDIKPNCEEYDPCAYLVDRICDDSKGIYECQCLPGYFDNKKTNTCEDIDECSSGKEHCLDTASSCVNINGSFQCSCNPGFWKTSWFLCTEGEKPQTSKLKVFLIILFIFLLIGLSVAGVHMWVFKKDEVMNEAGDAKSVGGGVVVVATDGD